jgi:hypothetical protein
VAPADAAARSAAPSPISGLTTERRLQSSEDTLRRRRDGFSAQLGEPVEQLGRFVVELGRDFDFDAHEQISSAAPAQCRHARTLESEQLSRLRAGGDGERLRTVEGFDLELGTQDRLGHTDPAHVQRSP